MSDLFPIIHLETIDLFYANKMLSNWNHKMGKLQRGNQGAICHGLFNNGDCIAITTASTLITNGMGYADYLNRDNCLELSRLCANQKDVCRIMIRAWRLFVFPHLGYEYAISYQDANLHSGNTYRFDGWQRIAKSRSGKDTRSGREGRTKYVWLWPPRKHHEPR